MSNRNQSRHMADIEDFHALGVTKADEEIARKERSDRAPAAVIGADPLLRDRQVMTDRSPVASPREQALAVRSSVEKGPGLARTRGAQHIRIGVRRALG